MRNQNYAFVRNGQVFEVAPYQSFIDINDVSHGPGWVQSEGTTDEEIAAAGLLPIVEPTSVMPDLYSNAPVLTLALDTDGTKYNRVVSFTDLTLDAMKTSVCAAIDAKSAAIYGAGYAPSLPALAGKTLQLRDANDKANWTLSLIECQAEIAQGNGAVQGETIITTDNTSVTLSFTDCAAVLAGMLTWGKQVLFNARTLKDAVLNAADGAAVKAVDLSTGWPS